MTQADLNQLQHVWFDCQMNAYAINHGLPHRWKGGVGIRDTEACVSNPNDSAPVAPDDGRADDR